MRQIVSRDNPLYRELLRVAGSARERRKRDASLIEGVHLCDAYLRRHGDPRLAIVSQAAVDNPEVRALLGSLAQPATLIAAPLFNALSAVEHGVGIAFLIDTPRPALPGQIDADCVLLDRIQDPGNVGTILRTCAAAGVNRVVTTPATAWCWSPKVLRAAMGAHFHLEIHEAVGWTELAPRIAVAIRATAATGAQRLWDSDLRSPAIWLFGNEGAGLDPQLLDAATLKVSIPQAAVVESLNVGVAAAVCLYEQWRQRALRETSG